VCDGPSREATGFGGGAKAAPAKWAPRTGGSEVLAPKGASTGNTPYANSSGLVAQDQAKLPLGTEQAAFTAHERNGAVLKDT
jgi:hypothetical protein